MRIEFHISKKIFKLIKMGTEQKINSNQKSPSTCPVVCSKTLNVWLMEKIKKVPFLSEVVGGIFPDMRERASFDQKWALM